MYKQHGPHGVWLPVDIMSFRHDFTPKSGGCHLPLQLSTVHQKDGDFCPNTLAEKFNRYA